MSLPSSQRLSWAVGGFPAQPSLNGYGSEVPGFLVDWRWEEDLSKVLSYLVPWYDILNDETRCFLSGTCLNYFFFISVSGIEIKFWCGDQLAISWFLIVSGAGYGGRVPRRWWGGRGWGASDAILRIVQRKFRFSTSKFLRMQGGGFGRGEKVLSSSFWEEIVVSV
jgi:hypothetical protein